MQTAQAATLEQRHLVQSLQILRQDDLFQAKVVCQCVAAKFTQACGQRNGFHFLQIGKCNASDGGNALIHDHFANQIGTPWRIGSAINAVWRFPHNIFKVRNSTGAGDGQRSLGINAPGQVVAEGAGTGRTARIKMDIRTEKRIVAVGNFDSIPLALTSGVIYIFQAVAARKGTRPNSCYASRNHHAGQAVAFIKSEFVNVRHAFWDRYAGQAEAAIESTHADFCHALRDRHAGQIAAVQESNTADNCHTFRNCHAGQIVAAAKGINGNLRHAFRNLISSAFLSSRVSDQSRDVLIE